MAEENDYQNVLNDINTEFPDFKLLNKSNSLLMKVINLLLIILSFGTAKEFMKSFVTTIGNVIYIPSDWNYWSTVSKIAVIRHERVHMRQSKKHGRFLFSVMYLFLPVPILFAGCRRKFEQEAYEESLRVYHSYYGKEYFTADVRERFISFFTSAAYLWIWVKRKDIEKWFDAFVSSLN